MSLLETAKKSYIPQRGSEKIKIDDDHMDLFMAWLRGEITSRQMGKALGLSNGSVSPAYNVAVSLRKAVIAGKITITRN